MSGSWTARHPRTAHCRQGWRPAIWPSRRRSAASRSAASAHRGRGDHRRHRHSGYVVSLHRLPGAEQAGREGRLGIRSFGGVLGLRLRTAGGGKLVESGAHKKVLVIGADVMSSIIDYTDRATCILFGDGAGAVLLEPAEEGEIGMIDFCHESMAPAAVRSEYARRRQPASVDRTRRSTRRCTTFIRMGRRYTSSPCARWRKQRKSAGTQRRERRRPRLLHPAPGQQAHHPVDRRAAGHAGREASSSTSTAIGNTTAAPFRWRWRRRVEEGRLKKGDLVLLASVGAGFTVGAALLRWEC